MKYSVVVAGVDVAKVQPVVEGIVGEVLDAAEKIFSHFIEGSEVSAVNEMPVGESKKVSDEFYEVYMEAEAIEKKVPTFSIQYRNPGAFAMSAAAPYTVTKVAEGTLDFCGIAKGWAVQKILDTIKAKAKTKPSGILVSWAGDVSVLGRHPNGGNWVVSVGEQDESTGILTTLSLSDGDSAATSGSVGIYNPRTTAPIEGSDISVVTVVTRGGCMLSDAMATACSASGSSADAKKICDRGTDATLKLRRVTQYVIADTEKKLTKLHKRGTEDEAQYNKRMKLHATDGTVIVVGGGLAGLCAAIEAAKSGVKVKLLEKMPNIGGNSAKATSGINGWGTMFQGDNGIQDNEALFERDTHLSGVGGVTDPSLVRLLSTQSANAIQWLTEEIGIEFTALSQLGGAARARAHRTTTPVGFTIIQAMKKYIEQTYPEKITIITNAKLTRLLHTDTNEVTGVVYTDTSVTPPKDISILGQAVVLATGGYGFRCPTLQKYRPDLAETPTTNGPWAQGDVYDIVEELKVSLLDMDKVQLHPTGLVNPKDEGNTTKILGPEALRGSGGILVNSKGKRFINELDLRSVVTAAIEDQGGFAYCIMNVPMQHRFGKTALEFYEGKMGLFIRCKDVASVAELIKCDVAVLKATLDLYGTCCAAGRCLDTEKVVFPEMMSSTDEDFLVAKVTPAVHYTMGGMEITATCEVQKHIGDGTVGSRAAVRRLFAAGECTGGVHGGNRLGGNSLLECVVMGRMAGQRAATIHQRTEIGCFTHETWTPITFREHRKPDSKYGRNSALLRFNLPGALQSTGLHLGEFIAVRGKLHGSSQVVSGFYSPVTRPHDFGCIDILMRVDDRGGVNGKFFASLRPGDGLEIMSMGGLRLDLNPESKEWFCSNAEMFNGAVRKFNLVAGGTGIAPMVQIIRGLKRESSKVDSVKLIFAAETDSDLSLASLVERIHDNNPDWFNHYFVLNNPPLGWTQGVNFLDVHAVRKKLHAASPSTLTVVCGPPIFERIAKNFLKEAGHADNTIFTYSGCHLD
eukprot:TRINITY_DN25058_c0_g1_i1.p1 TRINITY_DN25058_c0_g1~~TRINITY_DN25058_c0_g1_i1.p1  ORF type:complete len:1087 (+),score=238.15 TRINITY_DN25058_c0_g1_i1:185-3262(+)